jgi:hypothetical protein
MCLDKLISRERNIGNRTFYCVVKRERYNEYTSLFSFLKSHSDKRHFVKNKWYDAVGDNIQCLDDNIYKCGFHVFYTMKSAYNYLNSCNPTHSLCNLFVLPCKVEDVVAYGIQEGHKVIVAKRRMLI